MRLQSFRVFVLALAAALLAAPAARAADTVQIGSVDATSANLWPLHIAISNGYFAAENIKIDLVFAQSNASVIQQLAAGSYNIAPSAGMVDPIRAVEQGRAVALIRIVIKAPPYALLAKPAIGKIEDLKGKTIIIGGPKDITRIFTERMLAPHGLKSGDYDYVYAGATSARFSALKSGAVDAALLTLPFNFFAEGQGYRNLGFTFDYLPKMPFAGMAVNRGWALQHPDLVKRFLDAYNKGVAWFDDPANREAAVKLIMATASQSRTMSRRPTPSCTTRNCSSRPERSRRKASIPLSTRCAVSATSAPISLSIASSCRA